MGCFFDGLYYIDAFLSMWASSSSRIFQCFSEALAYLAQIQGNILAVMLYLDDSQLIGETNQMIYNHSQSLQQLAKAIGLPLAEKKTQGPATTLAFLGTD